MKSEARNPDPDYKRCEMCGGSILSLRQTYQFIDGECADLPDLESLCTCRTAREKGERGG